MHKKKWTLPAFSMPSAHSGATPLTSEDLEHTHLPILLTLTSGGWVLGQAPLLVHEAWYMLHVTGYGIQPEYRAPEY